MNIFDDCNPIDCALETLDDLGLNVAKVGILTREWSGEKLGVGESTDSLYEFSPNPRIVQINHNHLNKESGLERRGDIRITLLSKSQYPTRDKIQATSEVDNIEKYYYINEDLYELVEITEKLASWSITVRKTRKRKINL